MKRSRWFLAMTIVASLAVATACSSGTPEKSSTPAGTKTDSSTTKANPTTPPATAAPAAAQPAAAPTKAPAAVTAQPAAAPASKYPEKAIDFVVHTQPAAGADIMARMVSDLLTKGKLVAQPMPVTNKAGGSGAIAFSYVAEKVGDPYTILMAQPTLITTTLRSAGGKWDMNSFTALSGLGADESVVVVRADGKYKNMDDLIVAAKKAPKAVAQGGGALGASDSIVGHMIQKAMGVTFNYVSFGTGGEVPPALLGGNVDFIVANPSEVLGLVEGKKLKIIAVAADKRMVSLPDVPTLKEQGIDVIYQSFRGVVAPKGIPADAVSFWDTTFEKMLQLDGWKKFLVDNGISSTYRKSADFGKYLKEQTDIYTTVLKEMGQLK